jgi:hypothetical protein
MYIVINGKKKKKMAPMHWGVMLGPDLWVVDVNVILAFGSRRTSVSLGFLALNVKK